MTNPFVWVGRHELATLLMWLLCLLQRHGHIEPYVDQGG